MGIAHIMMFFINRTLLQMKEHTILFISMIEKEVKKKGTVLF